MKKIIKWFLSGSLALTCLINSEAALAELSLSPCAWPLEFSPEGFGNIVAPDDQARYWIMPFDKGIGAMKIEGSFPSARYFSFVAYNSGGRGAAVSVAGHIYDAIIAPDTGSVSPFGQSSGSAPQNRANGAYTVCIARSGSEDKCPKTNTISNVTADYSAWVAMRLYVPSADKTLSGQALMGGVPLPKVTLLGNNGPQVLETCPLTKSAPPPPFTTSTQYYYDKSVNKLNDIRLVLDAFFPVKTPEGNLFDIYTPSDYYETAGDRLWFAAPKAPPIALLPNPDNKYIAMQPGPYQRGRIIVIRGKAPTFLETYNGPPKPSASSRTPETRYWSLCNNDLALPVPAVKCVTDQSTITQGGFYTIVISDDLTRPDWLRPNINWLPWGDEQYPKLVFLRNMIPVARNDTNYTKQEIPFPYAIQWVIKGCPGNCEHPDAVIDFDLPYVPTRATFNSAGPNAQTIMGDYYPVAVWCDKSTFDRGGWQACIK
jgi:hypothetical protein